MKWTEEDFDREEDEGHNNICRAILSQPADTVDCLSCAVCGGTQFEGIMCKSCGVRLKTQPLI